MEAQVRMFRDESGLPRARAAHPLEALASFLEFDLQGRKEASTDLLSIITEVETQEISEWEGTGNAHTLTLTFDKAHIYNEFAIPISECELPLADFRDVVERWLEFLTYQRNVMKP